MKAGCLVALALTVVAAHAQVVRVADAATLAQAERSGTAGWRIRRVANMPDGAPAFEIANPLGLPVNRIECINNGWYDADRMAASLLGAPRVMAAVIAKSGRIVLDDLGPATFNCVVVSPESAP